MALGSCLLMLPLLTGCYSYSAVDDGRPEVGSDVRLQLTPQGREEMNRQLYSSVGTSVNGAVVAVGADSLALSISGARRRGYDRFRTARDTASVSLRGIQSVSSEHLRLLPTAGLVGAGVAALFFGFRALATGSGESPTLNPPTRPK